MSLTVYWACVEDEWMLCDPPESIASRFYKSMEIDKENQWMTMYRCPFFNKRLKNVYAIKSIYNYSFRFLDDGTAHSDDHTQDFMNEHVVIRSPEVKAFSFNQRMIFITEEDSLVASMHEFPVYEDNNITKRCKIIGGELDIGKYYRNVEFPFILKDGHTEFKVERGEVLYYIRLHTDERVKFVQFRFNDVLFDYLKDYRKMNKLGYLKSITDFYNHAKNKKLVISEIKKNLV